MTVSMVANGHGADLLEGRPSIDVLLLLAPAAIACHHS